MGYQVYWGNGRWQGYGVPAYCDHKGCKEEIDRGMGFAQYKYDNQPPAFFCEKHMPDFDKIVNDYKIDLCKEHPEWLSYVLNDESWKQWREENPDIVKEYLRLNITKEFILDKELNEILTALLKLKESMRKNNFSEDDMETQLLKTLESAGIYFSR